jgi:hypothetical protein
MARVVKMLTWTAILTLPGGVLLLPVVVAHRLAKRKGREELPVVDGDDAPEDREAV